MDGGTVAGVGTVIGLGLISYGLIKRKCKREVKIYEKIKYPREEDFRIGSDESGNESKQPEFSRGVEKKGDDGGDEGRGAIQDKSIEHDEQFDNSNGEPDKTSEPDCYTIEPVEPIED